MNEQKCTVTKDIDSKILHAMFKTSHCRQNFQEIQY